eukprot:SAG11_NODE_1678_length_4468_cov_14.717784_1_plen_154_part_00
MCRAAAQAHEDAEPDPVTEKVQEAYRVALADPALERLLEHAVVSETDKNMGPVIVSRRWLDSRKVETALGDGFCMFASIGPSIFYILNAEILFCRLLIIPIYDAWFFGIEQNKLTILELNGWFFGVNLFLSFIIFFRASRLSDGGRGLSDGGS